MTTRQIFLDVMKKRGMSQKQIDDMLELMRRTDEPVSDFYVDSEVSKQEEEMWRTMVNALFDLPAEFSELLADQMTARLRKDATTN